MMQMQRIIEGVEFAVGLLPIWLITLMKKSSSSSSRNAVIPRKGLLVLYGKNYNINFQGV